MTHYYSEPYKEKSLWFVEKIEVGTNKVLMKHQFSYEGLADTFLNTINIYINGEKMYSGV